MTCGGVIVALLWLCGEVVLAGEINTSTERLKETIIKLQKMDFYEDLQTFMVKFVMHFEIKVSMTIKTKHGEKEIQRDEEILKFDDFLVHSTIAIEQMRLKVNNETYRYDYPVHAFKLIYSHTVLIDEILTRMLSTFTTYDDQERIASLTELRKISTHYLFPTKDDLDDTMETLLDLQNFFSLKSSNIATGASLLGDKTEIISAPECVEIANYTKSTGNRAQQIAWLETAKERFSSKDIKTISEEFLYRQLYEAYIDAECQCTTESVKTREKLVSIDPDYIHKYPEISHTCVDHHHQETCLEKLDKRSLTKHLDDADDADLDSEDFKHLRDTDLKFRENCKRNIRNHSKVKVNNDNTGHQLFCYLERTKNFFYFFTSFKVEVLNVNPRVFVVHTFLVKSVQDSIIKNAKTTLLSANKDDYTLKHKHRVRSQSIILKTNNQHKLISSTQNKIAALTNTGMESLDNFYLTNYGIGGYDKLNKMLRNEKSLEPKVSVILFLSHINIGGDTVFPELNISVQPIEGAGLFVFHSNSNSTGSDITTFGACPVITGNKWIATQTII